MKIALRICDLESGEIADESFEKVECSVDEVESSDGDDDALILTDSLAVHLIERVLLLTVNRAYEGIDGGVSVGSDVVLELFIYYVQSFERSNFYTFSPLNDIEMRLVRLILIEKKPSRHGRHLKTTELAVQISIGKGVINSKLAERVFIPSLGWLIIVGPIVGLFC